MSVDVILFNTGAYYPGQTVEGKVVCIFPSSTNIRGIKLRLMGKEHTAWDKEESYTDDVSKDTKWRTVQYTGDNTFLEFQENLTGQGTQNPGKYEYPYRFVLPKNLPGTYTSPNGHVYYSVKANVDIPMGFDYESEKMFHVSSLVDLNEIPNLSLTPIQLQDEKTICCWCCADGPITMDVYLDRGVYILGEIMKLRIEVANLSNSSVEQIKIELINVIEEQVNSPGSDEKYTNSVLSSEVETGVGAHGNRSYSFDLGIPSNIDLPNFGTCILFRQYCDLKIEASLPGPHSNMVVEQRIKLGHIPPRSLGPPAYPSGDQVPPYPAGPPSNQPSVPTGPGWVNPPGGTPYIPTQVNAPSAPSKADLASGYNPSGSGNGTGSNHEPPPPSYSDAVIRNST